jgi:hypothetical protein
MDDDESSKLRRQAALKRKQLAALLCSQRQHGNWSNAVKLVRSAVDVRDKPQNNSNSLFVKKKGKRNE